MTTLATEQATLVTVSSPSEVSPLEQAVMDACNALHAGPEPDERAWLASHLDALLARYDETDGDDHPNPAWARPSQRALALSALGRIDAAIRAERAALRYADTPRRLEISLGNLCERSIRAGRHDDAVAWFLEAQAIAPTSVPVMLTGAQALFFAGHTREADRIFARFADLDAQFAPESELIAYLDEERRLGAIAPELPGLQRLFTRRLAVPGVN